MTKILEINSCNECPKRITYGNHWFCSEAEIGILNGWEIPAWCPLENMIEEVDCEEDDDN